MDISPIIAVKIVTLVQQGVSPKTNRPTIKCKPVSRFKGLQEIYRVWGLWKKTRNWAQRSTSEKDDRFIISTTLRNRHLTGVAVQ